MDGMRLHLVAILNSKESLKNWQLEHGKSVDIMKIDVVPVANSWMFQESFIATVTFCPVNEEQDFVYWDMFTDKDGNKK